MKSIAVLAAVTLLAGCFGYNSSAKKWAYVGDVVLIAGGGAAIGADLATRPGPCTGNSCPYQAPIGGGVVVGSLLVAAGVIGIIYNATRPELKTSR
jgi:hypothetical protein